MTQWRLLLSNPQDGFYNMAVDAMLLESALPAFRIYEWLFPTLSLGYFQPFHNVVDLLSKDFDSTLFSNIQIIRRMSGGGAIFHYKEITFSFILPFSLGIPKAVEASYQWLNNLLIQIFQNRGYSLTQRNGVSQEEPFFCYNRQNPYDLMLNSKKLIGCAQRRNADALLCHGSIPQTKNPYNAEWAYLEDSKFLEYFVRETASLLEKHFSISFIQKAFNLSELTRIQELTNHFKYEDYLKRR